MRFLRTIPPAYSPAPARSVLGALTAHDGRTKLSSRLKAEYGAADVLLTDSGTSALAIAIALASTARSGLPCALPAFGCYDLVTAAIGAGVSVRLYDIDPRTLGPDGDSLRRALREGVSSVVAVHLFGIPVDMDSVRAEADQVGATVIEDAAQGVGGRWGSDRLGGSGDWGVLSFGRGKGLTGGGGGALLSRTSLPERLSETLHGAKGAWPLLTMKLLAQEWLSSPSMYGIPARLPFLNLGETLYHSPHPPRCMPEFSARVVNAIWETAQCAPEQRRAAVGRLHQALNSVREESGVHISAKGSPGWLRFPFVVDGSARTRWENRDLGIVRSYPQPLSSLSVLRESLLGETEYPGASSLAEGLLTAPTHGRLAEADIQKLEQWLATNH